MRLSSIKLVSDKIIKSIENRDLLYISYEMDVPIQAANCVAIYSIHTDEHGKVIINEDNVPDPSTIYFYLPIKKPSCAVAKLYYYPHYIHFSPEQRWVYLNWLRNVDDPIDMGYVFLYYYGLEKQLLLGDFDKAFNQIIRLRRAHSNKSFHKHSENALIYACAMKDRVDCLKDLHKRTELTGFSNTRFLLAYNLKQEITADNLMSIYKKVVKKSYKPLKENATLLYELTNRALVDTYGRESLPIHQFDISTAGKAFEHRFANYSFPIEFRSIKTVDFYNFEPIKGAVQNIFNLAYDNYNKNNYPKTLK